MLYSHRMEGFGCWCFHSPCFDVGILIMFCLLVFVYLFFFIPWNFLFGGGLLIWMKLLLHCWCIVLLDDGGLTNMGSLICLKLVCLNTSIKEWVMYVTRHENKLLINSFIHSFLHILWFESTLWEVMTCISIWGVRLSFMCQCFGCTFK